MLNNCLGGLKILCLATLFMHSPQDINDSSKNLHFLLLALAKKHKHLKCKAILLRELFHFSECGIFEVLWARTPSEERSRTVVLFKARRSNNFIVSWATGDDCLHTNGNIFIFVLLSSVWSAIWLARRYCQWCYCWCCCDWWNERNSFLEFFAFLNIKHLLANKYKKKLNRAIK